MQAIRSLGILGCVLLSGCTFTVDGLSSVGSSPGTPAPVTADGGAQAQTQDGSPGGTLPVGPPATMPSPPTPGPVGAACDASHPCAAGLQCLSQLGVGLKAPLLPGGYCTSDCRNAPCPSGATCVDFGAGVHLCMADCPPSTCRQGYSCCDVDDGKVCLAGNLCGGGPGPD